MSGAQTTEPTPLPAVYQAWRESELGLITDRIEENLIHGVLGHVEGRREGRRVLDAGCGDAILAVALAHAGADVTGLDLNPVMLNAARERAECVGLAIDFVEGDVRSLPFPDASFDIVVAITVLCPVRDAEHAAAEMARALGPGGKIVVGELGRFSLWAAKRRIAAGSVREPGAAQSSAHLPT